MKAIVARSSGKDCARYRREGIYDAALIADLPPGGDPESAAAAMRGR